VFLLNKYMVFYKYPLYDILIAMENTGILLEELLGKLVLVRTQGGIGTKDGMMPGDYKGTLLAHDGKVIKLEYEVRKFAEGTSTLSKAMIFINLDYIMTVEEYTEQPQ
jgi:hypothetical protein